MTDLRKCVESLVGKASDAANSNDALKFSQAASNAANAIATLAVVEKQQG